MANATTLPNLPIISDQVDKKELQVILGELEIALQATQHGDVVEMGCYKGTTSIFLQEALTRHPARALHVYDSFAGLPDKTTQDNSPAGEQFITGELAASKKEFVTIFKRMGLGLPTIHKGWFSQLHQGDMPRSIAFAFLDGDYYESIKDSLRLVTPNLVRGARIVVDDYQSEALPGAKKAVDEWMRQHNLHVTVQNSLALVIWP